MTQLLVEDAGGIEAISELKLGLIRRVAALTVEAERLECQLADGQPVDIDVLARVSSHIRRISESIGLNRVSRDVSPTLQQIIAAHQSKAPEKPNRAPEASEATTAAADAESRTNASSPCSDDVIAEEEAT
ncbi:hypothetical protein IYY11_21065 [Methylocystis sp. H62]|uniref:hypothetical protein n=1 Tax=Methylocystis sp. H62 TaxID=2785789 RepID=UPI0018C2B752|nr:hypothetical protein [Methylocystis sp. H62]MBG0795854.1 hypothetical protein [Methylocystis sp. H62]